MNFKLGEFFCGPGGIAQGAIDANSIKSKNKHISKCMFPKCSHNVFSLYKCEFHTTFKKCMFPGCYHEKQKHSGKCKKHTHFKLCKHNKCNIYHDKGDYCKKHTRKK